jgi:hypothetical protein
VFLLDEAGAVVDDSASGGNPEIIILPVTDGLRRLRIRVEPFLVTNATYNGKISLGPAPFSPLAR